MTEAEIKNHALVEIEKLLKKCGSTLHDYYPLPLPDLQWLYSSTNRLIHDELRYDKKLMMEEQHKLYTNLTVEQRGIYDTIMKAVNSSIGRVFFLYGYGGIGKTYIWRTLSAGIRSKGEIILNVASSGIASLLLPGGRTAHSRFAIPINPHENSFCSMKQGTPLAELILKCTLIIWDEPPMMDKYCFEALDKSLKDIMQLVCPLNKELSFGGKTVVLGRDFCQILPVIPNGTRQDIVRATINSSYLWKDCTVLRLTKNVRLQNLQSDHESLVKKDFSEWIASIGDGTIGGANDSCIEINILDDILLKSSSDLIATIVESTYPQFGNSVDDLTYLRERAILAPTLDVVDSINEYMCSLNPSEGKSYFSFDSACKSDENTNLLQDLHTPEFLNGLKCSGIPNHELFLKVGTLVMLLRYINHNLGLCNGTRLVITKLGGHVLEAKILTGTKTGHKVLIPRMTITPADTRLPFKFRIRQYPLIVLYAMTINKSQGQSLSHVGWSFLEKTSFQSWSIICCSIKSYES